jgi:hypothetical protein
MTRMKQNMSRFTIFAVLLTLILCGFAPTKHAKFRIVSNSAVFNPINRKVLFTVEFSRIPNFTSIDDFGRQANSFQYYILGEGKQRYSELYDSIIRGEEIHITQTNIRIRNAYPPVSDPAAGGWGSIRATVPFTLSGNILTFSAPLSTISDHSSFSYELGSFAFGAQTDFVQGESTVNAVGQPVSSCVRKSISGLCKRYHRLVKIVKHAIRSSLRSIAALLINKGLDHRLVVS